MILGLERPDGSGQKPERPQAWIGPKSRDVHNELVS
jgi:hypothetical protein